MRERNDNEPMGWFMARPFGRHGHHGRGFGRGRGRGGHDDGEQMFKRILGHGDLRYVILALLKEKPSHGYELIKALEEKSSGHYTPSPGVIYPTLTFLEEGGFATASSEDNKKLFTITEAGKSLLAENEDLVKELFDRLTRVGEKMSRLRDWFGREEFSEEKSDKHSLRKVLHELKGELFSRMPLSKAQLNQVSDIIRRAVEEVRKIK